jgi:hypothetical protein
MVPWLAYPGFCKGIFLLSPFFMSCGALYSVGRISRTAEQQKLTAGAWGTAGQ